MELLGLIHTAFTKITFASPYFLGIWSWKKSSFWEGLTAMIYNVRLSNLHSNRGHTHCQHVCWYKSSMSLIICKFIKTRLYDMCCFWMFNLVLLPFGFKGFKCRQCPAEGRGFFIWQMLLESMRNLHGWWSKHDSVGMLALSLTFIISLMISSTSHSPSLSLNFCSSGKLSSLFSRNIVIAHINHMSLANTTSMRMSHTLHSSRALSTISNIEDQ